MRTCSLLFISLLLVGCETLVLDLSDIKQPIVVNQTTTVGEAPSVHDEVIAKFHTKVTDFFAAVGGSDNYSSSAKTQNPAQLHAFQMLGGTKNRAITDVSISYWCLGSFMLLAAWQDNGVEVEGKLREYDFPTHP